MESLQKPATVLIVDDDDLVRMTLSVLVDSYSYTCLVAGDGLEALDIIRTVPIDLVLTDLRLPRMDGLALLAAIREQHQQVGVIVAADKEERVSYAEIIRQGALDYIRKPLDQDELEAKLARAFREQNMVRALEHVSLHDDLTGLANARNFDQQFALEVERAFRQSYPLFLARMAIDNLRDYIHRHGQQSSDRVLQALAEILRQCTRNSVDTCARLGSDEFALLLPQTTADQATEIVQRILLRFVESAFGGISLSIAVVRSQRQGNMALDTDLQRIQDEARQALWEARKSGENCVVCRA